MNCSRRTNRYSRRTVPFPGRPVLVPSHVPRRNLTGAQRSVVFDVCAADSGGAIIATAMNATTWQSMFVVMVIGLTASGSQDPYRNRLVKFQRRTLLRS